MPFAEQIRPQVSYFCPLAEKLAGAHTGWFTILPGKARGKDEEWLKGTVLLVSCGEEISPALSDVLDCWGYRTLVAASSIDAARIARHRRLDMVILDISNGDGVAQEVLRDLRREQPGVVAVLLTACSDFPAAARAVQGGAYGYPEFVRHISDLAKENRLLRQELELKERLAGIMGYSIERRPVSRQIIEAAFTDCPVMITGEVGTGKSLLARIIHEASRRNEHAFVTVSCSSASEDALDKELFGSGKRKPGKIELARRGTLFLDEIWSLPAAIQVKLVNRLVGRPSSRGGARIIASTSRDLKSLVSKGSFCGDLYSYLSEFSVGIPPLRERKEDIPLLAKYFVHKLSQANGSRPKTVSDEALQVLMSYDWPGNVRELEGAIKQALMVGSEEAVLPADLPDYIRTHRRSRSAGLKDGASLDDVLAQLEREIIIEALEECNWRRSLAAKRLNISRRSLYNKLEKLNISPEREKAARLSGVLFCRPEGTETLY